MLQGVKHFTHFVAIYTDFYVILGTPKMYYVIYERPLTGSHLILGGGDQ